jgi:hypothetical protein
MLSSTNLVQQDAFFGSTGLKLGVQGRNSGSLLRCLRLQRRDVLAILGNDVTQQA